MNLKGKFLSLIILTIICLFIWFLIQDRKKKSYMYFDFGEPIPEDYQILGIDVSHHQGEINWQDVDEMSANGDSIHFVYLKATEATNFEDDQCFENAVGARSVDLPYGLYHFFRPDFSARKQALFFANKCAMLNDTLRPMLDVETNGKFGNSRLIDSVFVFMTVFEMQMNMRPIIYTFESFYEDYFENSYLKNDYFWIANYNGESDAIENENVILWQFSETGTVDGIATKVDLNVAKQSFNEVMYQD